MAVAWRQRKRLLEKSTKKDQYGRLSNLNVRLYSSLVLLTKMLNIYVAVLLALGLHLQKKKEQLALHLPFAAR